MPGVPVVESVAGLFIADIEPIAGIKKFTDAEPTSTGLPDASANVTVRSCLPFLSTPSELASVTVRLPTGPLLMVLPEPYVPEPDPHASANRAKIAMEKIAIVLNIKVSSKIRCWRAGSNIVEINSARVKTVLHCKARFINSNYGIRSERRDGTGIAQAAVNI